MVRQLGTGRGALLASLAALIGCGGSNAAAQQQSADKPIARAAAEWTVMIYMNAKNNLEPFAINNFREIAERGSTDKVNYVVEMGRPVASPDATAEYDDRYGNWSGVRRYLVRKDDVPSDRTGLYVGAHDKIDMGSPQTLTAFIRWAKATYPAKNYALVIWNHGQGYRLQIRGSGAARIVPMTAQQARESARTPAMKPASYRSVSSDDSFNTILYNADVRDAIAAGFAPGELKLLGFDACSMAMVETAYEMRKLSEVMVASQELEPGPGWRYSLLVPRLNAKPGMSPREFGTTIVNAYKQGYGNTDTTTLSLLDLHQVESAADRLSEVGSLLAAKLPADQANLETARRTVGSYKPAYTRTTVDAVTALGAVRTKFASDAKLVSAIDAANAALTKVVIANYASTLRQDEWGSKGISIFFPLNEEAFQQDPDSSGYRADNHFKPISFVADKKWSLFVQRYAKLQ